MFAHCEYYLLMRIVSKSKLKEFWEAYPQARKPLEDWYRPMKKGAWKSFAELQTAFPKADKVGRCTVFNIGGNKYRLIARVNYKYQAVFVGFVLTHEEYDLNKWKSPCSAD